MKEKMKRAILMGTLLAGIAFTLPAFAQKISLNDLQNGSVGKQVAAGQSGAIDKDHWAYKTLQNISRKYGLAGSGKNFEGNTPITRSEAAIIFVNLVGQVEDRNIQMTEAEKAKVEVLQQELSREIQQLSGRVAHLESGMQALEGRVTAVEERDKRLWGSAFGEDMKLTGAVQAAYYGNFQTGNPSTPSNFSIPYSEVKLTGKLSKHLDYTAVAVPTRNFLSLSVDSQGNVSNGANGILDELFVSTDIIPHHNVQLGQVWLPFGMEAPMYPTDIDFIEYSQISRNLGQGLDTGSQILGDWGFVNYTAGVYNGTGQNSLDNNHGLGYASQLNFKPLYKTPKFGELLIGGSHLMSKNATNNVDGIGGHISYDIGKFGVKFEYMDVDGLSGTSMSEGQGLFADLKYRWNDKLTLLTRFDQYNPDITVAPDASNEYVLGVNYALKENILLMVNYTYADRKSATEKDSSRLGLLTQVLF